MSKSANDWNVGAPAEENVEIEASITRWASTPVRRVCRPCVQEIWSPMRYWLSATRASKGPNTPRSNRPLLAPPLMVMFDKLSYRPPGESGETKSWMPNCELVNGEDLLVSIVVSLVRDVKVVYHIVR